MDPLSSPSTRTTVTVAAMPLAVALVLIVACGGDEEADNAGGDGAGVQTVPLTSSDFSFSPDKLSAQQDEPFQVVLTNAGNAPHTFTIDELDVDAEIAAGEETTVSVTPSDSGEFSFYCRFHRDQGMEGKITVSGAAGGAGNDPTVSPADDGYYDY